MRTGLLAPDAALARAVDLFNRSLAPEALVACGAALTDHPGHPGLQQLLATLCLATGDAAAALDAITPVLAAHPGHAPARKLAEQASVQLAATWIDQGRPAAAAALLRPLVASLAPGHPAWVPAWFTLALAEEDLGLQDNAAAALQQVLAHAPGHAEAWLNLGLVEQARGRLDAALDAHARAWALRPALLGRLAMALCAQRCGALWLHAGALEAELRRRAPAQCPAQTGPHPA